MTSVFVRVFAGGAEEHRGDSLTLGAAAYTAGNVPARYAGKAWTVQERAEPEPPAPPPPVVASMEQARADWAGRLKHREQVVSDEPCRRERVGEPQRAAAAAVPERPPDATPGAAETFWSTYLVKEPQAQQGPPWRRTRTG